MTGGSAVILLGEVEARSPGPRSWVAREEAVDRLRLGISALPMDQRRVVELCNAQGMNRADVGNLLIHADQQVRDRQLRELSQIIKSDLFRLVRQLIPLTDGVDVRARLPLVEMALPGLAATSSAQYTEFQTGFESLARADGQLDLFESMLGQVVKRHLRPRFEPMRAPQAGYASLGRLADRCAVVISALAYAGNADADAQLAFEAAANVVAGCRPCCQAR